MKNSPSLPSDQSWLVLWAGWIFPPVWWLIQFQTRYALVPWACRTGQRWSVPAAGVVALVVLLVLDVVVWRLQRQPRSPSARFLTQVGLPLSLLFTLAIGAQLVPDLFLDPCVQ